MVFDPITPPLHPITPLQYSARVGTFFVPTRFSALHDNFYTCPAIVEASPAATQNMMTMHLMNEYLIAARGHKERAHPKPAYLVFLGTRPLRTLQKRERYREPPLHGSIVASPSPAKCEILRVANVAPCARQVAAIWASAMATGNPARSRCAHRSA